MPINEMLDALAEEGNKVCENIISDARAQAKQLNKEAEESVLAFEKQLKQDADIRLEVEYSKAIRDANFSITKAVAEKKDQLIQELHDKLLVAVDARAKDSKKLFKELVAESIGILKSGSKELVVSVNKNDADAAKQAFNDLGLQCKIDDSLQTIGGLRLSTGDSKVAVDNTLESRIQKAWQLFKPEIASMLFGEK